MEAVLVRMIVLLKGLIPRLVLLKVVWVFELEDPVLLRTVFSPHSYLEIDRLLHSTLLPTNLFLLLL
jgi:hypothetical protein